MQTSKISIVMCAFMACAPLTMRATDTPAQAAARAQLEAKLRELDGQAAATPAPAAVATAPHAAAATEPVMKAIKSPKVNMSASEEASAKAKAKADKAAAELKARQDAEKASADLKARKQAAKAAKADQAAAKTKQEIQSADAGKDIGLVPIAAPTLPIDASKEARLQALLAKYQADQLSPEEYHKQRAAILAAP